MEAAMTFQAYLDTIKAKTGQTPDGLKQLADQEGVYQADMKAEQLVTWLASEFDLGRGHSMAVWAVWKDRGWVSAPK